MKSKKQKPEVYLPLRLLRQMFCRLFCRLFEHDYSHQKITGRWVRICRTCEHQIK